MSFVLGKLDRGCDACFKDRARQIHRRLVLILGVSAAVLCLAVYIPIKVSLLTDDSIVLHEPSLLMTVRNFVVGNVSLPLSPFCNMLGTGRVTELRSIVRH